MQQPVLYMQEMMIFLWWETGNAFERALTNQFPIQI